FSLVSVGALRPASTLFPYTTLFRSVLGGNPEEMIKGLENPTDEEKQAVREQCAKDQEFVKEIGGLHIIGTERHESRRIDNQLRKSTRLNSSHVSISYAVFCLKKKK